MTQISHDAKFSMKHLRDPDPPNLNTGNYGGYFDCSLGGGVGGRRVGYWGVGMSASGHCTIFGDGRTSLFLWNACHL